MLLCNAAQESRLHLFFAYPFSSQIYRALFSHHSFTPPISLMDAISWVSRSSSSKRVQIISKIILHAILYEIWKEKNLRLHSSVTGPTNDIIKAIQLTMRKKLFTIDRNERKEFKYQATNTRFFHFGLDSFNFKPLHLWLLFKNEININMMM